MSTVDIGGGRQLEVGILGATGMVGQQFVRLLAGHPWLKTAWLGASERSEGRTYREAMKWRLSSPPPSDVLDMNVDACTPGRAPRILFSALDASAAKDIEPAFAAAGHIVVSNARSYRMFADVPLVIPEVNADHLTLIARQRRERGWTGAIVTNPNCSTVVLSIVLAALRGFGLSRVMVTTLQAVSGAGYPGVASLDILGNVIPAISGEEEKMESETQKILGTFERDAVSPHPMVISATTTRVPVIDGHTELGMPVDDRHARRRRADDHRERRHRVALERAEHLLRLALHLLFLARDRRDDVAEDVERRDARISGSGHRLQRRHHDARKAEAAQRGQHDREGHGRAVGVGDDRAGPPASRRWRR